MCVCVCVWRVCVNVWLWFVLVYMCVDVCGCKHASVCVIGNMDPTHIRTHTHPRANKFFKTSIYIYIYIYIYMGWVVIVGVCVFHINISLARQII